MYVVHKQDLTYDEAYEVMNEIMSGQTSPTQNAAFLAALSTKSAKAETIDEIAGCAAAILGGALRAASLNVLVNTKAMGAAGAPLTERCLALLARGEAASDAVFKQVKERLL